MLPAMRVRIPAGLAVLAGLAAGCSPEPVPAPTPAVPGGFAAEHDFGLIPHGSERTADLPITLPATGGPWIPVGFLRSCSCAQHRFVVVAADGSERLVDGIGAPDPAAAVPDGGALRLRLTIRTGEKEVADLEPMWTPGQVVLQEVGQAPRREFVPLRFRYGIDAPFSLTPFAHIDLGEVPRPIRFAQAIEIRADRDGAGVELAAPRCVESRDGQTLVEARDVRASLVRQGEVEILEVTFEAGPDRPDGPFALQVLIPTDLDGGYELRIPVSGSVVPATRIAPPGWIAFGAFPFDQEREAAVMVTDHDPAHRADLHVVGVVDTTGRDQRAHFTARVEPVAERPRSRTVHLRYDGRLEERSFRGEVLLAREPGGEPVLRIEYAGFDRR
jgi:hypothetical protein